MLHGDLSHDAAKAAETVLGYLNFSTGSSDPQVYAAWNELFAATATTGQEPWRAVILTLQTELDRLAESSPAFRDSQQARAALAIVADHILSDYLEFHRDLLFHQQQSALFGPFFLGRVCEALLSDPPPWDDHATVAARTIRRLNDYIGYRPVAALQTQRIEPYEHEWVRPVPLFIRGAGAAVGPYQNVVELTLELLRDTKPEICEAAFFDLALLDELAFDPRAYDFDHPANKRPNYHFGQWDPNHIDNRGNYRRFVIQQVTLDALMSRPQEPLDIPDEDARFEAAAVLAGTILMASGISGRGPDSHDSTTSLASLLPKIAAYRDAFYKHLISQTHGARAERLSHEAKQLRQPFGGARQHLNAELARRRASQLEHVHLAMIFARMGFADSAKQQADIVPVASARLLCRVDCLLAGGQRELSRGNLTAAAQAVPRILELIRRGIHCGAIIDPWNIIGFDANFSLFPAIENSIHDHRADELVELMDRLFGFCSALWSESAAVDDEEVAQVIEREFHTIANWWRQYAVHEVSVVDCADSQETYQAARHVADALRLWHRAGAAAGDVRFWAPHAETFDSPKAYGLVIDALLQRNDFVASRALLIHWVSQSHRVPLEQGDTSFYTLVERWLMRLVGQPEEQLASDEARAEVWQRIRRFFDYLEANAEELWSVPGFEFTADKPRAGERDEALFASEEETDDLFNAAYEDMVYRDSTNDGVDGEIFDDGNVAYDALTNESDRICERLSFIESVARLWQLVAISPVIDRHAQCCESVQGQSDALSHWIAVSRDHERALLELLDDVRDFHIASSSGNHESMIEYDRSRLVKESLLERIIGAAVEVANANLLLRGALTALGQSPVESVTTELDEDPTFELFAQILAAMLRRDRQGIEETWDAMIDALMQRPLLYVPLAKGGTPRQIVEVRVRQRAIRNLLTWLPRIGMLIKTSALLDTSREIERKHPVGPGAVTEFDDLFAIGYRAVIESMVTSAEHWQLSDDTDQDDSDVSDHLVACLEQYTESMLVNWLAHSHTLRLSVLERVQDKKHWQSLVAFIQRYGSELFSQRFLNLANVRAILHQGVDAWFDQLQENGCEESDLQLLDEIDDRISRREAVGQLSLILEAIIENYAEYRDYNSTTTQSDRGEMLYTLLDFLRLRARYDRVCWNLKPVILAHEILVRRGFDGAARTWRRALAERVNEEADAYVDKLQKLQQKYAMRMPTVADRIHERFTKPLVIDRIKALVEPALAEGKAGEHSRHFEVLQHETASLAEIPTGVGLDVPAWLIALEEEVDRLTMPESHQHDELQLDTLLPRQWMSLDELHHELDSWRSPED